MKKLSAALPFFLVWSIFGSASSADGPRVEDLMPDDAMALVLIDDVPSFLAEWPKSPLGQMWDDDEVKAFFAPLRAEMELEKWEELTREATGFPLSEILEVLDGQAALILNDLHTDLEDPDADPEVEIAIIADLAPRKTEMLRSLMERDLERDREEADEGVQIEEIEEEFEGETLYIRRQLSADGETETEGWAIVDGRAVVAEPKAELQRLVKAIKSGGSPSRLSEADIYRKLRQRSPEAEMLFYFNLSRFVPIMVEAIEAEEASGEAEPDLMGITASSVFDALALDNLDAAYMTAGVDNNETVVDFGLLYRSNEGIVKLLAYEPGPVDLPNFIPADALSVGVSNFSLPKMWIGMKELAASINPMLTGMLDMTLNNFNSNAGFNLEKSLLDSLGAQMVTAQFLPPADQPGAEASLLELGTLYAIEVTDRQTLEMALEGLKNLAGPGMELFDEREYLGQTIYSSKPAPVADPQGTTDDAAATAATGFAYALTDSYLFVSVGGSGPLEAALSGSQSPERSIWSRKEIRAALDALPKRASAVTYYDVRAMVRSVFSALITLDGMASSDEEEDEGSLDCCDPDALPDPETVSAYFGIAVGYLLKEDDGLFSRFRILAP